MIPIEDRYVYLKRCIAKGAIDVRDPSRDILRSYGSYNYQRPLLSLLTQSLSKSRLHKAKFSAS